MQQRSLDIPAPERVAPPSLTNVPRPSVPVLTSTAVSVSEPYVDTHTSAPRACPLVTRPTIAEGFRALHGAQPPPQQLPTPVNLTSMLPFLNTYPARQNAQILVDGFTFGFRLGYSGPRVSSFARNFVSVRENVALLQDKIDREVQLGRIAGPFSSPPLPNLRCSPIGLVPKQTPGQFRLIHNLSSPIGTSVNDYIDPSITAVSYTSFDDAVTLVSGLGPGALMAKSDIKSAFRLLPVHPDDFNLLGFCVNGSFYYDKCMPMGCSISCVTFERFSTFLEYCARKVAKSDNILHYLDDFFFAGCADSSDCARALRSFQVICKKFGVPLASDKTEGPATRITFLGLAIDTARREIQVPSDKIAAIMSKLDIALSKKKLTLRELQSLLGSLNFICKAVRPGRAFLRRLFDLTSGVLKPHHRVRFSLGARADLLAWRQFFSHFNGSVMLTKQAWHSRSSNLLHLCPLPTTLLLR